MIEIKIGIKLIHSVSDGSTAEKEAVLCLRTCLRFEGSLMSRISDCQDSYIALFPQNQSRLARMEIKTPLLASSRKFHYRR